RDDCGPARRWWPCIRATGRARPPRRSAYGWCCWTATSWGRTRLLEGAGLTDKGCIGSRPQTQHHLNGVFPSPLERVGPRQHLRDGGPELLRDLVAERQGGQRVGQLGV